jgi:phosphoribosylformylglycinamidine cyclo-ligase
MARHSYAEAGVDLAKVRGIHRLLGQELARTFKNRRGRFGAPIAQIGHYAGLIDIGDGKALSMHTDSVGTKILVAQMMHRFDTVGIDCVAMTVNDLICVGSEPVALLDYIALEQENDSLVAELTKGLIEGAKLSSTAIVGGETAILKDIVKGEDGYGFDLAAMGVGVVEKAAVIDGSKIAEGDSIVGIESSGLHSNGFTLARRVLLAGKHSLIDRIPELKSGRNLGEELLVPTRIYVKPVLKLIAECEIHGLAHITGGAFSKLQRIIRRPGLGFSLEDPPSLPIFELIRREGRMKKEEMYRTFNMGVGFCVISPPSEVESILRICKRNGQRAFELGTVRKEESGVVVVGGVRVS